MLRTAISIFAGRDHNIVTPKRGLFGNISLEYFNYLNFPPFLSLLVIFLPLFLTTSHT